MPLTDTAGGDPGITADSGTAKAVPREQLESRDLQKNIAVLQSPCNQVRGFVCAGRL